MSGSWWNRRLAHVATIGAMLLSAPLLSAGTVAAEVNPGSPEYPATTHKITICHRTNSNTNPYVEITPAKSSIQKLNGHDTHEGPVWNSTLKSQKIKWGDIIPPFQFYATPQDEASKTESHYHGKNWDAAGQAIYRNGCAPEGPRNQQPSGSLDGGCPPAGGVFEVFGTVSPGSSTNVTFWLKLGAGAPVAVTPDADGDYRQGVAAPAGTTVQLQYQIGGGAPVDLADEVATVLDCSEKGTVTKTSVPTTGSTVPVNTTIAYTVVVTNTGNVALTNKPVLDILPAFVTVQGSPSDGGVVSGDGRTITWTVSLAPRASKTFTYTGLVAASAPGGTQLENRVRFLGLEATTVHTVATATVQRTSTRNLKLDKSVSPTGPAEYGDTLTYTLTVTAQGDAGQTAVIVTDAIPAGTTYVGGSIVCVDAGACSATVANGVARWELGAMAAGATRTVRFAVRITPPEQGEAAPARDIVNVGSVSSTEVGATKSNEVVTPVAAVLGVKTGRTPREDIPEVLARTGPYDDAGSLAVLACLMILSGAGLLRLGGTRDR